MKKQTQKLLGWAALGVGVWYLFGRSGASSASSSSADTARAMAPRPFGDPNDPNSVAYACNTATHLLAVGRPREAAFWAKACTAGGGTVPPDMAHLYP